MRTPEECALAAMAEIARIFEGLEPAERERARDLLSRLIAGDTDGPLSSDEFRDASNFRLLELHQRAQRRYGMTTRDFARKLAEKNRKSASKGPRRGAWSLDATALEHHIHDLLRQARLACRGFQETESGGTWEKTPGTDMHKFALLGKFGR